LETLKKRKKSGIDQIMMPACCPRQNEHINIKNKMHTTMSRPFYSDEKKAKKSVVLRRTFYFHTISEEILQIQT